MGYSKSHSGTQATEKGTGRTLSSKMERLKSRAAEIEIRINSELFSEARVIASTLVGADSRLLEGQRYDTVFIDEAAQALEAACWIPIRRASRVILAGDHCQLPPYGEKHGSLKRRTRKNINGAPCRNKTFVCNAVTDAV